MNIYGKEYGFKLTVGASAKIAKLCPDGDLRRIREIMGGGYANAVDIQTKIVCAMSEGSEAAKRFQEPGYVPAPLTPELLESLDTATYTAAVREAMAAFTADSKPTVEVSPSKKNEGQD